MRNALKMNSQNDQYQRLIKIFGPIRNLLITFRKKHEICPYQNSQYAVQKMVEIKQFIISQDFISIETKKINRGKMPGNVLC